MILVAVLVVGPDVDQLGNKKTFYKYIQRDYNTEKENKQLRRR
jgi:hypothetical protein